VKDSIGEGPVSLLGVVVDEVLDAVRAVGHLPATRQHCRRVCLPRKLIHSIWDCDGTRSSVEREKLDPERRRGGGEGSVSLEERSVWVRFLPMDLLSIQVNIKETTIFALSAHPARGQVTEIFDIGR
jgi:hypothetical protein